MIDPANPVTAGALQAIDGCAALTAAMLEAAGREDWRQVEALEARRRACLPGVGTGMLASNAGLASPGRCDDPAVYMIGTEDMEAVIHRFRELVAMDRRLSDLVAAARRRALTELRQVRTQVRGSASYHELSRAR